MVTKPQQKAKAAPASASVEKRLESVRKRLASLRKLESRLVTRQRTEQLGREQRELAKWADERVAKLAGDGLSAGEIALRLAEEKQYRRSESAIAKMMRRIGGKQGRP